MTQAVLQTNPRPDVGGDPVKVPLPECLTSLVKEPRWVAWKWEKRNGRWTKPPYEVIQGRVGRYAKSSEAKTWCRFEEALAADKKDGLGFQLLNFPEFGAIDLDDVRDPKTGALLPWAADIVARSGSYYEVTPSKTGVHILGRVDLFFPGTGAKANHPEGGSFEVYTNLTGGKGRYVTVSGHRAPDAPDALAQIDHVARELLEVAGAWPEAVPKNTSNDDRAPPVGVDWQSVFDGFPDWLQRQIKFSAEGDRSDDFQGVVNAMHARCEKAEAYAILEIHSEGPAGKYIDGGRLEKEFDRSWDKAERTNPKDKQRAEAVKMAANIAPTPFRLRSPAAIPPRQWLYGRHLISGFVSLTVSPGGLGKSSLSLVEALAMSTGQDLLGEAVARPLTVWAWNGEDPGDELERRVTAACMHYGIDAPSIGGRLYLDSGRDTPIKLATQDRNGAVIARPVADKLIETIRDRKIDVLIVDPFVTTHSVSENDNGAVNTAVDVWREIADKTGCAIELIHHAKKGSRAAGAEFGIDQARGASALVDAVRSARFLIGMTEDEAARAGLETHLGYFRVADGKANLAPRVDKAVWRCMESVALGNGTFDYPDGDFVGVAVPWKMPDAFDGLTPEDLEAVKLAVAGGQWKESEQAAEWVGYAIADALVLGDIGPRLKAERTLEQNRVRTRIRSLLTGWKKSGDLQMVEMKDEKRRCIAPFIVTREQAEGTDGMEDAA